MTKTSEIRLGPSWVLLTGFILAVPLGLSFLAARIGMLSDPTLEPVYEVQASMIALTGIFCVAAGITGLGSRIRLDERGILSYFVLGTKEIQLRNIA